MIRRYYKIEFELTEPLSLGSGETKHSDRDLLKNSLGEPFIPGTSLAGIYRTLFDEGEASTYFGPLFDKNKVEDDEPQQLKPSNVIVYDAVPQEGKYIISLRDSVGLDDFKTAKDGAKFDFEIMEPGAVFVTYIEQVWEPEDISKKKTDVGAVIAEAYQSGRVCFGHKTSRGYGGVKANRIWAKTFDLSDEENRKAWLDFDMYGFEAFSNENDFWEPENETMPKSELCSILLRLQLRDGISIREYTTDPAKEENESAPDYSQIYYRDEDGENEIPCVPGTSWAGAFRHHIKQLLPEDLSEKVIDAYFGYSKGAEKKKSRVRFSESQIKNSSSKVVTRNAIDRFTGGIIDKALYTEKTFLGGNTELTITFPKAVFDQRIEDRIDEDDIWRKALAAAITDLDLGFLAVGGLTAVGRGLFRVLECCYNGSSIYKNKLSDSEGIEAQPDLYRQLVGAMDNKELERGEA